ncbi:family 16 glycoside hydrolase [Neocallimastix lanati (nom. inval.)]|uniref:Family 16 glycoside hydrolase n=1 Tax=Neocallimastix californiae TaxID=1754190 RepID=A0A1Y2C368_9FUNG|nr:family 16 glycoside hydrolase [Neocallimastix sp. JGI-2020a]ORY41469.1 family 16 glycoside hydrolase [Neocallimastix californiae]|eukprot:ORY41469.1 family 16 glycoside hydrolase [Neocallimastix californiae]
MKFFALSSLLFLTIVKNTNAYWETLINDSLKDYGTFEKYWAYLYPWGSDHNGSARMYGAPDDHNHVYLENNSVVLQACRINWDEGKSTANPHPVIHYHSGAIHSIQTFTINDQYPNYEIRGEFIAPTTGGTWPAFWLNGAWTWPPEIDILEFKGTTTNWFNTFRTSSDVSTYKEAISNPNTWHEYRLWISKVSDVNMDIHFYIDGKWRAKHTANHVGKPFHLIMNLQMEGSASGQAPSGCTLYRGRNIYVGRSNER